MKNFKLESNKLIDDDEYFDSESEPSILELEVPFNTSSLNKTPSAYQAASLSSPCHNIFFAVQFNKSEISETSRIFRNKENAMKLCKQDPENRTFKASKNKLKIYF